ncbi:hypothetical protein AACH28_10425 [Sphingobacterium thalpophilum]|uniref:Uncharacterized protein n=1 Tax=Sphingobacterium thalpophilum TaxID=259 RepID=A0ACD5C7Q1_9SPHI
MVSIFYCYNLTYIIRVQSLFSFGYALAKGYLFSQRSCMRVSVRRAGSYSFPIRRVVVDRGYVDYSWLWDIWTALAVTSLSGVKQA